MRRRIVIFGILFGCGGDGDATPDAGGLPQCDDPPAAFAVGDPDGHAEPLGAAPGEARAGRIDAAELAAAGGAPELTWAAGDFVLANDRIALVIEDAGDSDLYDPWGGKPVGMARVEGGALIEPADYGEQFLMVGGSTLMATSVSVLDDGSGGGPAIVRAAGRLARLPFLEPLLSAVFVDEYADVHAALDYALAPDSNVVEVTLRLGSPRRFAEDSGTVLHGFMYTYRMPMFVAGEGFTTDIDGAEWVALIDDDATSWAYQPGTGEALDGALAQSGFVGGFTAPFDIEACGETERLHARLLIGGPGVDGLEQARAPLEGRVLRAITGTVGDGVAGLDGFHVHAVSADGAYLTRATTTAGGQFTLHVPASEAVNLTAYRRGWATGTAAVEAGATEAAIVVPPSGFVHVQVTEGDSGVPARVQLMPSGVTTIPTVPEEFGEEQPTGGRLEVAFPADGDVTIPAPVGTWDVIVSRGYEYELVQTEVVVAAGLTTEVDVELDRVVDTGGVQCGDFHIHTRRSNDSEDPIELKLRSAAADGVELPVRTDHEWVDSFQPQIEELGLEAFAFGIGSIEMTSFQIWGHFGVFPLDADPTLPNAGAPAWQRFPTVESPDLAVETLSPVEVFAAVRDRPEEPVIIINHPRGSTNYFDYVGFDRVTGLIDRAEHWDEEFTLVEVFNDAHWLAERDRNVADWFALLEQGRPIVAVGSSDSHGIRSSPVGYPRTCIEVGTDDPQALTAELVRDQLAAGHATVSGGIYVDAAVGAHGPGDTATGTGELALVDVRVQAASWVDVDAIDVVVDGETVQTIEILPEDADPENPAIRWQGQIEVAVDPDGSWAVFAAYGDATLEPVHPGRIPFGVTNPIWMER